MLARLHHHLVLSHHLAITDNTLTCDEASKTLGYLLYSNQRYIVC